MSQQLFKAYFLSINQTFKDLPKGNFYWRFFKRDLGRIINIPCPIDSLNQQSDIHLFKELRAQIGISEENVCSNCPFVAQCSQAFQQFDNKDKQNLLLPNLSRFIESITVHNLNIQNQDDSKSFWLASNRILDTFHAIVKDFQKNSNQLNQLFLQDIQNPSDTEILNNTKQNLKPEKYYRAADFMNENEQIDEHSNSQVSSNYQQNQLNQQNKQKKQQYSDLKSQNKKSQRSNSSNQNNYQAKMLKNEKKKFNQNDAKFNQSVSENKKEVSFSKGNQNKENKKKDQNKAIKIKNEKQIKKNMKFRIAQ